MDKILRTILRQMRAFGFVPTFDGDCKVDYHSDTHWGVHFIDEPHYCDRYRSGYDVYVHINKDGRCPIFVEKNGERRCFATIPEAADVYFNEL